MKINVFKMQILMGERGLTIKKLAELREAAAANGKAVKPGSLADKVGMVSRYNEVNDKRK